MNPEFRPKKYVVGVIGPRALPKKSAAYTFVENLGKALINEGFSIVCGGRTGAMEAVCKGACEAESYSFGCTIGILPGKEKSSANPYCDLVIPTGIGVARNLILVQTADILVAIGGGSGTLSELAFSWQNGKHVICCTNFGGWSAELAGRSLDPHHQNLFHPASTIEEILSLLNHYLPTKK
ncbi:TIGR00725 family protein [Arundinibacter roseus]|uniref:TIGR00725 family protein n=1 Tax=Arundinibacter roseus TaxID=2070510 RepID=A0A4R4KBH6_9BACT|nr:TIGR00725 family protein [Arundinibacter roseus]TDB65237.1 TIGR00725 family protein [Arundinibacter roseus]